MMKQLTGKKLAKGGLFLILVIGLVVFLSALFTPTFYLWSQDNSSKGVYKTPKNTIQVTFLGTSQVGAGISPMVLYEDYGICANMVASGGQPMAASHYWMKEIWERNPESLTTVVVDASSIVPEGGEGGDESSVEKALSGMRLGKNKIEAMMALREEYGNVNVLDNLIPIFRYHSRWTQLTEDDFTGMGLGRNYFYTMGYMPIFQSSKSTINANNINVPNYQLTDEIDTDEAARRAVCDDYAVRELGKMADFCREKGLNLILIKIPKDWTDVKHDALTEIGQKYDIPVLDMNDVDIIEEIGLDFPNDYYQMTHANYYGATKMTKYLGKYLTEHYSFEDVRGEGEERDRDVSRKYRFMEDYAKSYDKLALDAKLSKCGSLTDYLQQLSDEKDRYRIFISVVGDGAAGLPDSAREQLAGMGFSELAELGENERYIGISDGDRIVTEKTAGPEVAGITVYGTATYDRVTVVSEDEIDADAGMAEAAGADAGATDAAGAEVVAEDAAGVGAADAAGTEADAEDAVEAGAADAAAIDRWTAPVGEGYFRVTSSSFAGMGGSCIGVYEKDYGKHREGLNIVVINRGIDRIVDSVSFDTHADCARTSDTDTPAVYERRMLESRLNGVRTLEDYLNMAQGEDNITLLCVNPSIKKDQTQRVLPEALVEKYGMSAGADAGADDDAKEAILRPAVMSGGEDYFAVIYRGKAYACSVLNRGESFASDTDQLSLVNYKYVVGDVGRSYLVIGNKSYSVEKGEMFVLTYDQEHNWVVASRAFALPAE